MAVLSVSVLRHSFVTCNIIIFQGTPNSSIPLSAQGRIISMLSDRLSNLNAALKGDWLIEYQVY